ncbi:aspartate carbamoyltransferase catalytic subunit [Bombilactobacillus bombi]|uniref:aspartate carbamoyltransferase catalytic subunit n=1 Tax=Bombilactobacillus bombi TaxID=1303590 RepID=UPI000E567F6B|nr:aspartate carbamoyltransferase catalytic subunit [Bombilactobacillus bombi]AXX64962.1 aspartate carbamoyltransferase catalytic subunit [Bombilactobacillus bombi]
MIHDLVNVNQLSLEDVRHLINLATAFKQGAQVHLRQPAYAMNLFFENSTRTHTSFEMAERKLGLQVLPFVPSASSITKGESLSDTVKTLQAIGVNLAVIRHPQNEYYQQLLADNLQISIANGGDGSGQHPSQSLLDIITIFEEFKHFAGLKVGIVGDLAHSRVARSNAQLLQRLGAQIYFSGPKVWFAKDLQQWGQYLPLEDLIKQVDVLMLLRVQHERFAQVEEADFNAQTYYQQYGLTPERYQQLQPHTIIMHPAPVNRGVEIASELVESPQSRIFRQMQNGVYARMAIVAQLLASQDIIADQELKELSK